MSFILNIDVNASIKIRFVKLIRFTLLLITDIHITCNSDACFNNFLNDVSGNVKKKTFFLLTCSKKLGLIGW